MVREATRRRRRYEEKIHPDVIGARFRDLKDVMVDMQSEYFPQISLVESKVKADVEAAGVPTYQVAQYINVGRECFSIAKRFSQATRDAEAQRVVDKWASRGLDGTLLARACMAGGCAVTPPAAVCYNPCEHGSDVHDETVHNLAVVPISAKIADISESDTLKHFLDLEAALGETRKIVKVQLRAQRVTGTGAFASYPNEGTYSLTLGHTYAYAYYVTIKEGSQRLQYAQNVADDDWDIICLSYTVEA